MLKINLERKEKMTFSQWKSKRKAAAGGIKGSTLPKSQVRRNSSDQQPITELQVSSAKTQNEEAQNRARQAQREYEQFMNRQMAATSIDSIDFLETGGQPAAQVRDQRNTLWQNYQQAQATADQTEKNYSDLLGRYTTQVENAEKTGYQQMELTELEAKRAEQREAVARNQAAATQAQTAYGLYMNEQWNQPYDFLPSAATTRQDQLLDQAYATHSDLTRSRESLFLMDDVYNYRNDMQIVSGMTDVDKLALAMYGCGRDPITFVNALTPEQRQILRDSGKYKQLIMSPDGYLTQRGYKKEDLGRLAESYGRYLNAERMANTQEKAETFAEENPFWATVSTYPAELIGKATSGVAALGSDFAYQFGLSNYHGIDVNRPGYVPMVYSDTTRNAVSDDFTNAGRILYNVVNDYIDDKVAEQLLGEKGAKILDMAGAFGHATRNTAIKGGTPEEGSALGVASAGIELVIDDIEIDKLLNIKTEGEWEDAAELLFDGVNGMTEEKFKYIGNCIIQTAILAEDSDFQQRVDALMMTGFSEEDAKKIVYEQLYYELVIASTEGFLGGML